MEEMAWEGILRWLYAFQVLACALVLYSSRAFVIRKAAAGGVAMEKTAATIAAPRRVTPSSAFIVFQRAFLTVFLLASMADGLQQVYGEALYQSYALKRRDIALLLAVGHATSVPLGTFLGASADTIGRKRMCMLYCFLQVLAFFAKQMNNFKVLCFAHVCLGLSAALYFSAFEAWMTTEHEKMGFKHEWLNETFWMMSLGMGIVAIGSGALANFLVEREGVGTRAPSFAAAVVSMVCFLIIKSTWMENVGVRHISLSRPISNAFQALQEKGVALLGWAQACFDLAVAIFWLLWIPTLVADGREVQSGLIYTCLMASRMLGSSIAALLQCGPLNTPPGAFLPYIFLVAAGSLFLPAYDYQEIGVLLACFCVFHICVGIIWPSLAHLHSIYIPNDRRAAVLSLFRVPVHGAILFIIVRGELFLGLENSTIFALAIVGLLSAAACIHMITQTKHSTSQENGLWKVLTRIGTSTFKDMSSAVQRLCLHKFY
ncbi:unnamed protein product [Sphagnum jensenii]|uniref:Molybdate-anion transporter n=1 Tax=Sphagnum jensenii TaxID=128206 RepID=A0ABP1AWI6_9BRYO